MGAGATEPIDRELIVLSGAANPKALFIPTASEDSEEYVEQFSAAYSRYGCEVTVLRLLGSDGDRDIAKAKIAAADLIYVGGGNTKMMLEVWRAFGVDVALRAHLEGGKPAGGLSAGAICWFRMGNSDWPLYEGIPGVNTAPLDALGFVDLVLCPHTRDEGHRLSEFRAMMQQVGGVGLGLDDCCAIEIVDDQYRILASEPLSIAHRIEWNGVRLIETELVSHTDFRPLADLTTPTPN